MNTILTGRTSRSVACFCLLVPLACSATGDRTDRTISPANGAGGGAIGGAAGAAASPGAAGFGATHGLEAPGAGNAGAPPVITGVMEGNGDPGGCTKDQNILFVIDRSGSMQCNPPPTTDSQACERFPTRADPAMPSKLEIVQTSMSMAFDLLLPSMMPGAPKTRAGLAKFSTDDMCATTVDPLVPVTDTSQQTLDGMRMALTGLVPGGTTPIVNAMNSSYQYFMMHTMDLPGDKHVILVTDGADTCTPQQGIQQLINTTAPQALAQGIRTWVIGAPGSERARSMLSHLAKAGGTGKPNCDVGNTPTTGNCHYDMTMGDFATTFAMGLAEILKSVQCGIR